MVLIKKDRPLSLNSNKSLGDVIMVFYLDENMQFQLNALIRVLDNVQLHPLVFYELLKL